MKKYIAVSLLLVTVFAKTATAQDEEEKTEKQGFDKSKLFFGGNFGLSFGTNTYVNLSPQVGYRFNQYLAAGAGVNFNYLSVKYYNYDGSTYKERIGYTGLNVFGRFYPIPYLLVQAQPELNYSWGSRKYSDGGGSDKLPGQFVPSLLIGGGGAIPTGGHNGALIIMAQYDVIQNTRSPYGNKVFFTIGYNF